ncbi:MAG: hypothetical protein E6248_14865 [Clostridium sp.]|uniref:hypothetical protein n=1 Tax=Clostridium sp. TaxID=1506 RepID=UPI002909402A|nr:hypothetical protein [Clostridium sp.]MDU5111722.1 hypothetical protein [Clostridium sp.]
MMKKNKVAIIIGSAVVIACASAAYFLNQFQNDGSSITDKDATVIQNDSNNSKLDKNEENKKESNIDNNDIASIDNQTQNNLLNSNTNIDKENEFENDKVAGGESQGGTEMPEVPGVNDEEEQSETPNKPETPNRPENPNKPDTPDNSEKPAEPNNPGDTEKPGNPDDSEKPEDTEKPDKPNDSGKPEDTEKPEIVVNDLTITKNDLVDGVVTISNKIYKNIYIDSSIAMGKVVLENVEVKEKLSLEDGVQYKVDIKDSTVPYVKVGKDGVIRYHNRLLNIDKNISGPTLYLENVKEVNNVDINGNASILGDSKISNLHLLNGTLVLNVPTEIMSIDENSNNADITINQTVEKINDSGNNTIIGVNGNVNVVNSNGDNSSIYIKEGAKVGQVTINGDSTKIMGNGTLSLVEINGSNVGIYTDTSKDKIVISEDANNVFIGREEKYEISTITLKQQGIIEFTLNEPTSSKIELSDLSIICHGGNTMSVFNVATTDNKTYTLNTSYYKDNTYELYITLPNGKIISKEFEYSYNHPTASKVMLDRTSQTEAIMDIYGVDEGGYLYYKLVEKTKFRFNKNVNVEDIKENGTKVSIKTEYNEISISDLKENKEYDVYYVMEGFDGRTSPVYGPFELGKYEEKAEGDEYKLVSAEEVVSNRFVFKFNKPVKGELKLEDFSIICPSESALTTKGAKFIVSSDKQTYTIIVPDNYGHKDNKYTVSVNMPDGTVVEGSFTSHFNPPAITGDNIDHYSQNKIKFGFNSDEHGTLYYGVYEWNNSVFAGDSTTPMAEDVLSGKVASTKVDLYSGYNELDIDLSGYELTNKSRLWVLFVDYDGNYRKGFVDHFKIPEFIGEPDGGEEDKSLLDITNIEISEGGMGTRLELTFNEDLSSTFGQNDIKLQSLSGVNLPGKIGMSVSFPSYKPNYASIDLMGVTLKSGDYRITIETYDSEWNPVTIVKEFTVE